MTIRPLMFALAAATAATGCSAVAQTTPSPNVQANQTRADYLARAAARFDRLDTNRDGVLTAEERRAGRTERGRRGERGMRRGPGGGGERRGGLIMRMDQNNDGRVSREEMTRHATERAGRMFDRLDRNRDGFIDAGELPQRGRGSAAPSPAGGA